MLKISPVGEVRQSGQAIREGLTGGGSGKIRMWDGKGVIGKGWEGRLRATSRFG